MKTTEEIFSTKTEIEEKLLKKMNFHFKWLIGIFITQIVIILGVILYFVFRT